MIEPVPAPTNPDESSATKRKVSSAQDLPAEGETEFDKVIENIAIEMAKDYWGQQDIK